MLKRDLKICDGRGILEFVIDVIELGTSDVAKIHKVQNLEWGHGVQEYDLVVIKQIKIDNFIFFSLNMTGSAWSLWTLRRSN